MALSLDSRMAKIPILLKDECMAKDAVTVKTLIMVKEATVASSNHGEVRKFFFDEYNFCQHSDQVTKTRNRLRPMNTLHDTKMKNGPTSELDNPADFW